MSSTPDRPSDVAAEAYDEVVARLERVVAELEAGKLTLEGSIDRFAEGVRLAREATRKLDDAERRIDLLVRTADGGDEEVPFVPEGAPGGNR
jgi:exodeoxyribonuclease VII small subunit